MQYHKITLTMTVKVCSKNEAETFAHDAMLKIMDLSPNNALIVEDGYYIKSKVRERKLTSPFSLSK